MLDLDDHRCVRIGLRDVGGELCAVAMGARYSRAARTQGRILGCRNGSASIVGSVYHRHNDTLATEVERLLQRHVGVLGYADDGRDAPPHDLQDQLRLGRVYCTVLAVEEQPVESTGGEYVCVLGRACGDQRAYGCGAGTNAFGESRPLFHARSSVGAQKTGKCARTT